MEIKQELIDRLCEYYIQKSTHEDLEKVVKYVYRTSLLEMTDKQLHNHISTKYPELIDNV